MDGQDLDQIFIGFESELGGVVGALLGQTALRQPAPQALQARRGGGRLLDELPEVQEVGQFPLATRQGQDPLQQGGVSDVSWAAALVAVIAVGGLP